jgi:hypothetical protein
MCPAHSERLHKRQLRDQSGPRAALFHSVHWIRVSESVQLDEAVRRKMQAVTENRIADVRSDFIE